MTHNRNPEVESALEAAAGREAEATLRLVAQLAPPVELTERVRRRLAMEASAPARRGLSWFWNPAPRLQLGAAALLAIAVAGSAWNVYRARPARGTANGAVPATISNTSANSIPGTSLGNALPAPGAAHATASGAFGSAGAERMPPTRTPIKVPPPPRKKPVGGKNAAKPHSPAAAAPSNPISSPRL